MGLLSWIQSKKQIFVLQQQMALLEAYIEGIDLRLENLKNQIISVRQRGYKSKNEASDEPQSSDSDLREIMNAFGGQLPIELAEKYKNNKQQQ